MYNNNNIQNMQSFTETEKLNLFWKDLILKANEYVMKSCVREFSNFDFVMHIC